MRKPPSSMPGLWQRTAIVNAVGVLETALDVRTQGAEFGFRTSVETNFCTCTLVPGFVVLGANVGAVIDIVAASSVVTNDSR